MVLSTFASTNNYLIKQLPNPTVFVNTHFEIVYASDSWVTTFNFEKRDITGKAIHDLLDQVNAEWQAILDACLLGKGDDKGIIVPMSDSKRTKLFKWTHVPWYNEDENIIGLLIQAEEVTKHNDDSLELEKLKILLNEKSEIAGIGSWEYSINDEKLTWCNTTRKIYEVPENYEPELNENIDFFQEGFSRNTLSMAIFKALEKGISWNEQLQLTTAQGNEIWVISAGKPLYHNDKLVGLLGTIQDINHHVKSEVISKERENLLRTVIDNLPINVYIKDLESRKILVNKAECEYLGVESSKELLGKSDFDLYDKEIAEISRKEDLAVLNTQEPIMARETLNVKKDGTPTTFLTSKIPLIGDDGKAYGLVGISMDISNLKRNEQELRDLINVTSLQNKKLVNFAHIISHNLRSHTANFSMLLDFMVDEKNEEERQKMVEMLIEASDNLLDTLDNLNEVVSLTTTSKLEKTEISVNDTLTLVEKNLSAYLKNQNAQIINQISDDVKVKAIPSYLENILMNFITNSVKYRSTKRDPVITLTAEKRGSFTIIHIKDNGLGIDLKKHGDKLFGMYKTFNDNTEARGIGLYLTKNQIEAMNGKIEVYSEVGEGTIFSIHFDDEN